MTAQQQNESTRHPASFPALSIAAKIMGAGLSIFGMPSKFALITSCRVKPTNHDHQVEANTLAFFVRTADAAALAKQAGS